MFSAISKLFSDNAESSSLHGLSNILRNKNWLILIIWIICIAASTSYCIWNLTLNFMDFFKYETNTATTKIRKPSIEFPAVTFCNKNPFKNQQLYFGSANFDIADYTLYEAFNALYVLKLNTEMEYLGFSIDDMLIECSYNRVNCGSNDFEHTISPEFGNCYTFNSGRLRNGTRVSLKKSFFPGIKMELSLTLSTGTSPATMKTRGIILFIHNASTKPSSNIDFLDLTPGLNTNIAVKQEYTIKLPKPYSNCAGPSLKSSYNSALFNKTLSLFGEYQQKSCLNLCYYEYIKQRCGCYFPDMYGIKYSEACNLNDTTFDCINRFFYQYINSNEPLKCFDLCPEECETISYDYQISQSEFPTQFYFSNFLESNHPDLETFESGRQSTLAVNIFFNDIILTVIEDTKKKTFQQLLAEVGGFLGLCLGASFLTMVELAEILVKIIFLIKEKRTNEKSTSPKI